MDSKLYFYDPNHGNCLRIMNKIDKDTHIINGAYGVDEGKKGFWAATAKEIKPFIKDGKKYNLKIDFSMKKKIKHEKIYYAYFHNREINWQDGNTWLQLYA